MTVAGPVSPSLSLGPSPRDIHDFREHPSNSRRSEQESNRELSRFLLSQEIISNMTLKEAARKWPEATRIEIQTTSSNTVNLKPNFISKLAILFPKMRELSLTSFQQIYFQFPIDNAAFVQTLPKLTQLRVIELQNCSALTAESLTALFRTCTQLQKADISSDHLTNEHLELALKQKSLVNLALSGANQIDEEGLELISRQGNHLQDLTLDSYPRNGVAPFTLTAAKAFAATLPQLQKLRFDGCEELDDDFVQTLMDHHSSLRKLELNPPPAISEDTNQAIFTRMPLLNYYAFGDEIVQRSSI
ncbi:MAG: hypothetical protein LLG04_14295 [Parachlamydia sp.]|nr:hypothetical protein [Parachlamydia sp.]